VAWVGDYGDTMGGAMTGVEWVSSDVSIAIYGWNHGI
jgi:hypothetical protein